MKGLPLWALLFWVAVPSYSQISAPGLGTANTASWFAFALRQNLDSAGTQQSVSYIGVGTISDPDNYNPYTKHSIYVVNEEFYHKLGKNWQYSVALSYRRQKDYEETAPFYETKGPKQEIRLYGRLSYTIKLTKLKWVNTIRQELRTFYTPQFSLWEEPLELRTRLRTQLTVPLSPRYRIVSSLEVLMAVRKEEQNQEKKWSAFEYRESRLCLYVSTTLSKLPLVANLGYMNNLIGYEKPLDVHYLMMDVIWENPFGKPDVKKKRRQEFLE